MFNQNIWQNLIEEILMACLDGLEIGSFKDISFSVSAPFHQSWLKFFVLWRPQQLVQHLFVFGMDWHQKFSSSINCFKFSYTFKFSWSVFAVWIILMMDTLHDV